MLPVFVFCLLSVWVDDDDAWRTTVDDETRISMTKQQHAAAAI
jgi:hypothetical protein